MDGFASRCLVAALALLASVWSPPAAAQSSAVADNLTEALPVQTDHNALWSFELSVAPGRAVDVRYVREGVAGFDLDGDRVWTLHHSFKGQVPMRTMSAAYHRPDLAPVVIGRLAYYATAADLVTVDVPTGQIVDRTRFPAGILGITRTDDGLRLEIGSRNAYPMADPVEPGTRAWEQPWRITISHVPGTPAPRVGPADELAVFTTARDATLTSRLDDGRRVDDPGDAFLRDALLKLRVRQRRDPTNPFFTIHRGLLLENLDEPERATRAFRRAAKRPTYHWTETIQLAFELAGRLSYEKIEPIFERGLAQMRRAGIDQRHFTSLVWLAILTHQSTSYKETLKSTFEDTRVERVDDLAGMIAKLFPKSEMANLAYAKYAEWFRRHDRPDLAAKWQTRAERATGSLPYHVFYLGARRADLAILTALTTLAGLIFLPIAFGLRIGRETAATEATGAGLGWRALRALRWTDLAALVALAGVLWGAVNHGSTAAKNVQIGANSAVEVIGDAFWAPPASRWLEHLEPSDTRDRWLAYTRDRRSALTEGRDGSRPAPSTASLADAVWQTAGARSADGTGLTANAPNFPGSDWLQLDNAWKAAAQTAGGFLFFLVGGFVLGVSFPAATRWLRWLIPGGAPAAGLLAAPIFLAVVAGALAVTTGLDEILYQIAMPSFDKYYMLEPVDLEIGPSHLWAYVALPVGLAGHFVTHLVGD